MEVVNKKDGNKNFMIIKGIEIDENDYKFKMLKNNNIENVIPIGLRVIDGEKQLYYNVTEYITVKAMFSRKKMSGKDLYNLIKDIKKLSKSTKEYLMDLNDFLFDINYVYINKKTGEYGFCYCPNEYEDVQQNMRNIFDSILECIDHNNKPAVLMEYSRLQLATVILCRIYIIVLLKTTKKQRKVHIKRKAGKSLLKELRILLLIRKRM